VLSCETLSSIGWHRGSYTVAMELVKFFWIVAWIFAVNPRRSKEFIGWLRAAIQTQYNSLFPFESGLSVSAFYMFLSMSLAGVSIKTLDLK